MANTSMARQETPFDTVPAPMLKQSVFDLSHDHKLTFSMGELIPFLCIPVQPNDSIRLNAEVFTRFSPMLKPIIHRVNLTTTYFYCPNRILWRSTNSKRGWEEFIAEADPNGPVTWANFTITEQIWNDVYTVWNTRHNVAPGITPPAGAQPTTLLEYMGFRQPPNLQATGTLGENDVTINALPIAAYWKIWNDYYRRPQIQGEYEPHDGSMLSEGDNAPAWNLAAGTGTPSVPVTGNGEWLLPVYRNWNLDSFTVALPTPQAGTEVLIPMVAGDILGETPDAVVKGPYKWLNVSDDLDTGAGNLTHGAAHPYGGRGTNITEPVYLDTQGTAATIRQLRLALATQEFLERLNRTGNRYRDVISGFFGRDPMAGVIDYAEFIGKSQSVINITDVMTQTNNQVTGAGNPELDDFSLTGSYAGKALGGIQSENISYTCQEHGFIIGLINIQPVSNYMDATQHFWYLDDRYDYAWSEFAGIGDEEVKNKQVAYYYNSVSSPEYLDGTFGYVPRYTFWRYVPSYISGEFKDVYNYWHLGREINASDVALNNDFLTCKPRYYDVFQVGVGTHEIYAHVWNQVVVRRNLPKYGVPTIMTGGIQ